MAFLDETGLKHLWDKMLDKMYPVGSIYMSVNSTSPADIYGGTWEQIKGKFLLAEDGSTYKAGTEGGEASHTLTVNEMPSHSHSSRTNVRGDTADLPPYTAMFAASAISEFGSATTISKDMLSINPTIDIAKTGGGLAHNNMPPYLAVYIWKRTA